MSFRMSLSLMNPALSELNIHTENALVALTDLDVYAPRGIGEYILVAGLAKTVDESHRPYRIFVAENGGIMAEIREHAGTWARVYFSDIGLAQFYRGLQVFGKETLQQLLTRSIVEGRLQFLFRAENKMGRFWAGSLEVIGGIFGGKSLLS